MLLLRRTTISARLPPAVSPRRVPNQDSHSFAASGECRHVEESFGFGVPPLATIRFAAPSDTHHGFVDAAFGVRCLTDVLREVEHVLALTGMAHTRSRS